MTKVNLKGVEEEVIVACGGMTGGYTFKFTATKMFGGTGEFFVNGEKVDEIDMPQMHRSTYSLAEAIDVGIDTGTQVAYRQAMGTRHEG